MHRPRLHLQLTRWRYPREMLTKSIFHYRHVAKLPWKLKRKIISSDITTAFGDSVVLKLCLFNESQLSLTGVFAAFH